MELTLNNLQRLMCHKTKQKNTQTNNRTSVTGKKKQEKITRSKTIIIILFPVQFGLVWFGLL